MSAPRLAVLGAHRRRGAEAPGAARPLPRPPIFWLTSSVLPRQGRRILSA